MSFANAAGGIASASPAARIPERHSLHAGSSQKRQQKVGCRRDSLHLFGGYDGGKPIGGDVFTLDCSDPASMESEGGEKKKKDDAPKEEEED